MSCVVCYTGKGCVQVRAAMERCLTSAQAAPDGVGDRPGAELAGSFDTHRAFVPTAAGERVSAVVLALLVALLLVFHNCCKLYTQVAASGERLATARRLYGRVMTGLVRREGGFAGPAEDESTTVHALAEAASADRDTVWGLLQKEIVGLFSYLIRSAPPARSSASCCGTGTLRLLPCHILLRVTQPPLICARSQGHAAP